MADSAGTKTEEEAKKDRMEPDPARETDLVVSDTRRNPEEAKENKTTGCVIPPKDVLQCILGVANKRFKLTSRKQNRRE